MKKAALRLCLGFVLFSALPAVASTTYHGTFTEGATLCKGVFSPADPGTVDGTWNLNVKDNGEAEVSVVIFRDGKNQANWGFVQWESAADNNPDSFYHYIAVLSPFLRLEITYDPSSDAFVFQAFHPSSCIGAYHADQVVFTGPGSRAKLSSSGCSMGETNLAAWPPLRSVHSSHGALT